MQRSTATSTNEGAKTINAAAIRTMAKELNWRDEDIISQVCEGGIQPRSDCGRRTILAFHHKGLLEHPEEADATVHKEMEQAWISRPLGHLPYVPCRVLPRNVVLQERTRITHGANGDATAETILKCRATVDSSHGGEESVNAGVARRDRAVLLPSIQMLAQAVAIISSAASYDHPSSQVRATPWVVDCEAAYMYVPVQHADRWMQTFFWGGSIGTNGVCIYRRLTFGGAFGPNRFERLAGCVLAYARRRQRQFDDEHPPPDNIKRWSELRRAAQARGELNQDPGQLCPSYTHLYIDDACGCSLSDPVPTPASLAHIEIDRRPTELAGGTFPAADSRALIHVKLLVDTLATAGLHAAPDKILVGDPITALGFRVSARSGRLDVPPRKREVLLHSISSAHTMAREHASASRSHADRLLGQLANIAQAAPELTPFLCGGYRILADTYARRGGFRAPRNIQLRRGSVGFVMWMRLLEAARYLLTHHKGVPLAPASKFPGHAEGAIISQTDASGTDGFGGFVWIPGDPHTVHWVSEKWPAPVLAARANTDKARVERAARDNPTTPLVSMPVAELWAAWMVPLAVLTTRPSGTPEPPIIAICDCQPAVHALNKCTSGEPNMTLSLSAARSLTQQWLAVHVNRDDNKDADALSHPGSIEHKLLDMLAPGMRARRARPTREAWNQLLCLTQDATWRSA